MEPKEEPVKESAAEPKSEPEEKTESESKSEPEVKSEPTTKKIPAKQRNDIFISYGIGFVLFCLAPLLKSIEAAGTALFICACLISAFAAAVACPRFNKFHFLSILVFVCVPMTIGILSAWVPMIGEPGSAAIVVIFPFFYGIPIIAQTILQLIACLIMGAAKKAQKK